MDVFLDWWKDAFYGVANELGALVEAVNGDGLKLQSIANRGVKVYPGGFSGYLYGRSLALPLCRDAGEGSAVSHAQLISLLQRFDAAGLDVIKTENLYNFDGAKGLFRIKRFRSL